MINRLLFGFFILVCSFINDNKIEESILTFHKLTCNYQENPIVINGLSPQFSWVMYTQGFNKSQSAYHILVSSSREILNSEKGDVWDSNKVLSNQSVHIPYEGFKLKEKETYYWKVKVWDEKGNNTSWSDIQQFSTGMDEMSWLQAKWIRNPEDKRTSEHRFRDYKTGGMDNPVKVTSFPTGYFKNVFKIKKGIKSAKAYIAALGYYELQINGRKVEDHVLDPAPTNYDKNPLYVVLDVKDYLQENKNAIGIILGNGFYGQNLAFVGEKESETKMEYGVPIVKLYLDITYQDGTHQQITTNENWRAFSGPIVFDNVYSGEVYDARFEIDNWNSTEINTKGSQKVLVIEDPIVGKLVPQTMPPIRKIKTLKPIKIFKAENGNWIVDFGQNIAGWITLKVKEKKGQRIDFQLTEALSRKGNAIYLGATSGNASGFSQQLTYICKSEKEEIWEPRFTYHGFRYAEVSGLSKQPTKNSVEAILVATDIKQTGAFESSSELLNEMDKISKWTIVDNIHGIPEDCPQREKCGWLGDAHAWSEFGLYTYDLNTFYMKYMEDIRTQFRAVNGNQVETEFNVPTMIAPGKRTSTIAKLDWGIATIYLPWYHYLYSGDTSMVKEYYDDMKQLTNYYLTFKSSTGIIDNGMGDWCPPRWDRRNNPSAMECDPIISASAYFYDILRVMNEFAYVVGDKEYQSILVFEMISLKNAFNANFLKSIEDTDSKWYGSQTATVMALQFNMVPETEEQSVLKGLIYNINSINKGHHTTGIHGNRYLYTALSNMKSQEVAFDVLTNPEFPSQGFIVNSGFTTWPERQWDWGSGIEFNTSLNHPMHSGFAAYFYESLGGLKSKIDKPGFKEFVVNPIYPKSITHTQVSTESPYGKIRVDWKVNGNDFEMELEVPFNATAILPLSISNKETLLINSKEWKIFHSGRELKEDIRLGSGIYKINYKI